MNPIFRFFRGVGKLLGKALGIVRDQITEEDLGKGIAFVKAAEEKFLDNRERREWVVERLRALGLPEFIARIVVELALRLVKKETQRLSEKAAGAIVPGRGE